MEDLEPGYLDNLDFDLEIDDEATASIKEASKWTRFISIFMFSICGLLLIVLVYGVISINFLDDFNSRLAQYGTFFMSGSAVFFCTIIIVVVLLFATIYYFLMRFSQKVKLALISENTDELNKGWNSLKVYFIIYAALGLLSISTSAFSLLKLLR